MTRSVLSRRALLRGSVLGTGVGIALPALEAMVADRRRAHAATPMRLVTLFWPNGAHMEEFTPKQAGPNYELPKCLTPFAEVKSQLLVVTGLMNMGAQQGIGDSHEKGRVCFATAVPCPNGRAAGGPSLEQFAAQKVGQQTKFSSLVLAPATAQGENSQYLSWAARDRPVQPDMKPSAVFAKLFGGTGGGGADQAALAAVRRKRRSVLDFVKSDLDRLQPRLGMDDRRRLTAHAEAVRDVERRIMVDEQMTAAVCVTPSPPPDDPQNDPWQWTYNGAPVERMNLLMDLLVAAFRCDLTRTAGINLYVPVTAWLHQQFAGETRGHHDISHDNAATDKHLAYTRYQVGFLADLMRKLAAVDEGSGSLLDNTIVYASSEISHGGAHNYSNLPVLVGGGRSKLKTGQHHNLLPFLQPGRWDQVKEWVDLGRLFLTLLQAVGTPADRWGAATAPLSELLV